MKQIILLFAILCLVSCDLKALPTHTSEKMKTSFNVGPGWYKTDFALVATSLIPINEEELQELNVRSQFKTKQTVFPLFVGDILLFPHKNCTFINTFAGGTLHHGRAFFQDTINNTGVILKTDPVCFNASLFAYGCNVEIDFHPTKKLCLKPKLGYNIEFGSLITTAPKTYINYHAVGPLIGLKAEWDTHPLLFTALYTFTIANYKKTANDTAEQEVILISFPNGFIQTVAAYAEYQWDSGISLGIRAGYNIFTNHGRGTALPIPDIGKKQNSYALYNQTSTISALAILGYQF